MKLLKPADLMVVVAAAAIMGCGPGSIPLDDPKVEGTGPGAVAVLEFAESKLSGIRSISAVIECTKTSDMYGFEKVYEGALKAEFGGKPGSLGSRWHESQQNAKGKKRHIRGIFTDQGMMELHLLKKKAVKGDKKASSESWIATALSSAYGLEDFYGSLKDYAKRSGIQTIFSKAVCISGSDRKYPRARLLCDPRLQSGEAGPDHFQILFWS